MNDGPLMASKEAEKLLRTSVDMDTGLERAIC